MQTEISPMGEQGQHAERNIRPKTEAHQLFSNIIEEIIVHNDQIQIFNSFDSKSIRTSISQNKTDA